MYVKGPQGNLDFDKRKCAVQKMETPYGLKYDLMFYGMSAEDMNGLFPSSWTPKDTTNPYAELSVGGRKPSGAWVTEEGKPKAFFTAKL